MGEERRSNDDIQPSILNKQNPVKAGFCLLFIFVKLEAMYNDQPVQKQNIFIPITILISGLLIAGAIYLNRATVEPQKITVEQPTTSLTNINAFVPVTKNDHVLGNLSTAEIVIVDYSDLECPYCKILHETLMLTYKDFESTGKVAWVYRHFPMSFHTKAPKEAEAAECVNELGGNDLFWDYIHMVFANTPSNDGLDPKDLTVFAEKVGVDKTAFESCLTSGKYAQKVKESYENTMKLTGVEASPFTVIVDKGKPIPLVDANGEGYGAGLPHSAMKALIDQLLVN